MLQMLRLGNATPPVPIQNTTGADSTVSLEAFDEMLELYGGVLTLCSLVAIVNYHRVKFPMPISLSLSGLMMSLVPRQTYMRR